MVNCEIIFHDKIGVVVQGEEFNERNKERLKN